MSAKKTKEGEMAEDAEKDNAEVADTADGALADAPQKLEGATPEAGVKPPEQPRKSETAPKADAKPASETRAPAKSKPKEGATASAKPTQPKSLAEVMKFDLKIRRRPRF